MTDTIIVELLGVIVAALAVGAPIVRLNGNIATLNATLNQTRETDERQDRQIEKHDEQIDELNTTVAKHDARIEALERE